MASETETRAETKDGNGSEDDEEEERKRLGAQGQLRCFGCKQVFTFGDTGGRYACKPCQVQGAQHPQVESAGGFLVDEKMLDLINLLVAQRYDTENSCQGGDPRKPPRRNRPERKGKPQRAWVQFASVADVQDLMRRARACGHCELYEYLSTPPVTWQMLPPDLYDDNDAEDELDLVDDVGQPWSVSLRFPATDIQRLTNMLAALFADDVLDDSPAPDSLPTNGTESVGSQPSV